MSVVIGHHPVSTPRYPFSGILSYMAALAAAL